jgi:hypothetical protein
MELSDLLKERIQAFNENPKEALKQKGIERNKDYAKAVKCFQDRINKDRIKAKQKPLPFIAIKMKLIAVREVDDLRAWYRTCLEYSYKKNKKTWKRQTFSQCFFGGTKTK